MSAPRKFELKNYGAALEDYTRERSAPEWEPVRLGIGSLDADLRGISAGQVLGIAARTGVGKTYLLEAVEHNVSVRPNFGTLAVSLEMPAAEWAERALALFADVPAEQVEEWARDGALGRHAAEFLERMQNARLVDEPVQLTELAGVIRQAREALDPARCSRHECTDFQEAPLGATDAPSPYVHA